MNEENNNQYNEENLEEKTVCAEVIEKTTAEDTPLAADNAAPVSDSMPYITVGKKSTPIIITAVVVALVLALVGTLAFFLNKNKSNNASNPYNDTTKYFIPPAEDDYTIAQVADDEGKTLEDLIAEYHLPADMPSDTSASVAMYYVTTNDFLELNGFTFEEAPIAFGEGVTGDTLWGDAEASVTIGEYFGMSDDPEELAEFKEYFGLGDEITPETKYGDVRYQIAQKQYEEQKKQREEYERMMQELQEEAANATEEPSEEASADGAEATAAPADTADTAEAAQQ